MSFTPDLNQKFSTMLAAFQEELANSDASSIYKSFEQQLEVSSENFSEKHFKVLVVDHDEAVTGLLKHGLTTAGCSVVTAVDAMSAAEEISHHNPDLVILDVTLPDGSGMDVMNYLRSRAGGNMIPVIFLSAKSSTEDIIAAFQAGADDYVVKPFDMRELIARVKAFLIKTYRFKESAIRDELTGFYNRRFLREKMLDEFARWKRYKRHYSIVMLDIDDFKKINDTYGHIVGDVVLQQLADFLRSHIRAIDVPIRFGGEEFIILLPETKLADAEVVLTRIYANAAKWYIQVPDVAQELKITFCAGAAGCPEHGNTFEELVGSADRALYRAKGIDGKNSYFVMRDE